MHFRRTDCPPHEMLPGEYRRSVWTSGQRGASLRCPQCRKRISLGDLHIVGLDGAVRPSFVCTHCAEPTCWRSKPASCGHPQCTFHENITLDDYDEQ